MKPAFAASPNGRLIVALYCCAAIAGTCMPAAGRQPPASQRGKPGPGASSKKSAEANRPLDGAWRLVRTLDPASGQLQPIPQGFEMTKLVVGGRFAWIVAQNGQAVAGAGGTCSANATTYSETVAYAVTENQQPLIGTTTKFTWTLKDGKWHHKGTIRVGANTQKIEEIWERIPEAK